MAHLDERLDRAGERQREHGTRARAARSAAASRRAGGCGRRGSSARVAAGTAASRKIRPPSHALMATTWTTSSGHEQRHRRLGVGVAGEGRGEREHGADDGATAIATGRAVDRARPPPAGRRAAGPRRTGPRRRRARSRRPRRRRARLRRSHGRGRGAAGAADRRGRAPQRGGREARAEQDPGTEAHGPHGAEVRVEDVADDPRVERGPERGAGGGRALEDDPGGGRDDAEDGGDGEQRPRAARRTRSTPRRPARAGRAQRRAASTSSEEDQAAEGERDREVVDGPGGAQRDSRSPGPALRAVEQVGDRRARARRPGRRC